MTAAPADPIALPTPFLVGDVNVYLVDDDPLTLVDTGPDSGTTLIALVTALAQRGRRIEDLERIVLTHQHIDHIGLAAILAERSGAEVVTIAPLAPALGDYLARAKAEEAYAEAQVLRHGIPREMAYVLRAVLAQMRAFGKGVEVTRTLRDGEELGFAGRTWRAHHLPGHSPSDTVLHDERSGELIAGDHLIRHISSNALVSLPLSGDATQRPRPLTTYLDSLARSRALETSTTRPGHGRQIDDHRAVIDRHVAGHERRAAHIAAIVAEHGPLTAFDIARRIFDTVAMTQAFLTFSEVYGHLDLLRDRGEVAELGGDDDGGPVRWATAGP